jgi:signal transduction histidine kinase
MQVLMSRRPPGDPETTVMRDIVRRIDALGELINDLMVFARPRPPRPHTIDLRLLIAEAATMLRRDPAAAAIEVKVEGSDVTLTADSDMLKATLQNLLINAAQAMEGRGRIDVAVGANGGSCTIQVHDSGPGIPANMREQVFEPFFTTKSRGGGLGLPVARRTAELHGGSLTLECPPRGGTVATLTLPLRSALPEQASASDRTSRSGSGPDRD